MRTLMCILLLGILAGSVSCSDTSWGHQLPVPDYCPTPNYCPESHWVPSSKQGFGLVFDWGVRLSPIVGGVSNVPVSMRTVDKIVVSPDSVILSPTVSAFVKGIGFSNGDPRSGQFRIGVRPEIVLSPHVNQSTNIFNLGYPGQNTRQIGNNLNAYWGAQVDDWVVPEYLMEYNKERWGVGVGYKVYHLSLSNGIINSDDEPVMHSKFDLANLKTLSLYFRWDQWSLGYSFVVDDNNVDGPTIDHEFPFVVGFSF